MVTKHSCKAWRFGRKTVGCPRCDELLAGAPPKTRPIHARPDWHSVWRYKLSSENIWRATITPAHLYAPGARTRILELHGEEPENLVFVKLLKEGAATRRD